MENNIYGRRLALTGGKAGEIGVPGQGWGHKAAPGSGACLEQDPLERISKKSLNSQAEPMRFGEVMPTLGLDLRSLPRG